VSRDFAGPAAAAPESSFLDDVLDGLSREHRVLPCKYFYDELGSALFDQICETPEYYPTRTELAIMRNHAGEIAAALGPRALVVEFGSGSSTKTRVLLDALQEPAGYVPVDISGEHLERSAEAIRSEHAGLAVHPIHADFTRRFTLPTALVESARRIAVYFPGSTIGNFTPEQAEALMWAIGELVGHGGHLLVGTDLVKPVDLLEAAYDDASGVTARFNLNLLARINRELDGDFDVERFRHVAIYEPRHERMEIFIESLADQSVRVGDRSFAFSAGERILTEYSHKYTAESFERLGRRAGFSLRERWTDPEDRFAVQLLLRTNADPLS
jgi:dimethylhistidine N-methyltransferase